MRRWPRGARLAPLVLVLCMVAGACGGSGAAAPTPTNPGATNPAPTNPAPTNPGATSSAGPGSGGGADAAERPCGWRATPPSRWDHVIWIWMENRDYQHIVGNPQAPYENRTLIANCGSAVNYHNITHPSLPNYLAATSGHPVVAVDCQPSASCSTAGPSLFSQLRAAGRTWRAYQESMPANCTRRDTGAYAARHNPPVYYTGIAADCANWDLPMGSTTSGNLAGDLRGDALPDFSFITPNLCDDSHDCPAATGDRWLASWMPVLLGSPAYRSGNTVIVLTWDEGDSGGSKDCATDTTTPGCHIPAVVIAPSTRPGSRPDALFNHYSLLRTTQELLGLPTTLGPAAASMRSAFNL